MQVLFLTATLQYLDVADWSKYLQAIATYKDHVAKDAEYYRIFHHQHLARVKGDSKAEIKLVCFFVNAQYRVTD